MRGAEETTLSPDPASTGPVTVPDFSVPPAEELRACSWWRSLRVGVFEEDPPADPVAARLLSDLLDAFGAQGHALVDGEETPDILLVTAPPVGADGPLAERFTESRRPLLLRTRDGRRGSPEHLVTLVTVPDELEELPHPEVVDVSRTAMARLGSPKIVFLSGDAASGELRAATFATLEGGHPTDRERIAERLRDRLVSAACAREVGGDYVVADDALPREPWERTDVPEAIIEAGRRMDDLGLLPAPHSVSEYVSGRLARLYERFLGIKGFSEGMLFAFDPATGALMLTASGSWEVDKRALRREDIVPVGAIRDGEVVVLAPGGARPKGPSVEALEMRVLVDSAPSVRLRESGDAWEVDPEGPLEAPLVRAGIHAHVGVEAADAELVETVPANREDFPYGFGCGTDLMCDVVRDVVRRSAAINDPADPRRYVRWPMLYHGDTVIELWKPGAPARPLEGLLDLYESGAIRHTTHHIAQPV